jgi:folate-binding protein YgfZ
VIVDRSDWGHLGVRGGDRQRFLQGLCTVNVDTLALGEQKWGALLNPKGRVLSIFLLENRADTLVLHCEAALAAKTLGILERYAVMDDVEFLVETGPAYQEWTSAAQVWAAPLTMGPLPAAAASADEVEALRVEAGFLRYGVDVDENHFPFETPLAAFLDYGKGCYVGQEPVFRVHSQGSAARVLRGLRLAENVNQGVIHPGAALSHPTRPEAGKVTSVARSPRLGVIALAYLHRTVSAPGTTVQVGGVDAILCELPFAEP